MLSILEAREKAIAYDDAHNAVGVSYKGGFTAEWVLFEPVEPEWEGYPGYAVNRLTGDVNKIRALDRKLLRSIYDSPDLVEFDLKKDADQ